LLLDGKSRRLLQLRNLPVGEVRSGEGMGMGDVLVVPLL
jgi:hypothetical protein